MSIKVNCGKVVAELKKTEKSVFAVQDIKSALRKISLMSASSFIDYVAEGGYLEAGGFLTRCIGGWKLTDDSTVAHRINIEISPAQHAEDVLEAIKACIGKFGDIVTIQEES